MENKNYYYVDDDNNDCDENYQRLIGPDDFRCTLTEPEDRTFYRDLSVIVKELNKLYKENLELKSTLEYLQNPQGE